MKLGGSQMSPQNGGVWSPITLTAMATPSTVSRRFYPIGSLYRIDEVNADLLPKKQTAPQCGALIGYCDSDVDNEPQRQDTCCFSIQRKLVVDGGVREGGVCVMTRDEALKLLKCGQSGIAVWNQRRRARGRIPDLSNADLNGADLSGANLSEVNLSGAQLGRARFIRADLSGANLSEANLNQVNLRGARLGEADLSGADASDANLSDADLSEADFSFGSLRGADMHGANLSGADLSEADISGADLTMAILSGANLSRANLMAADLSGADLSSADLSQAVLSGAKLSAAKLNNAKLGQADLSGANLSFANLSSAHLAGANLIESKLSGAKLNGANLNGAVCWQTIFSDVDLSRVNGLDSITHGGPSIVDTITIFRSAGKNAAQFLRACGVPDIVLGYLPCLIRSMRPLQFDSYSVRLRSRVQAPAQSRLARIDREKIHVGLEPEDTRDGRKSIDPIDHAIRVHDKLFHDLSKAGDWVRYEITRAIARQKKEERRSLFPIGLVSSKAMMAVSAIDPGSGKEVAKVSREYPIPDLLSGRIRSRSSRRSPAS
jgi:uncharacterized protein YjbI with pentapeptide repeats